MSAPRAPLRAAFERGAVLTLFLALSGLLTWPLAWQFDRATPGEWRDGYQRACDAQLVTWAVDWNARHLLAADWAGIWDANLFYPAPRTLAYSEHFIGTTLPGLPVYLATGDPILLYNVLFVVSFAFSGFAAALLVRDLTGRWNAAIAAGLVFGFCPYRYAHLNQLHVLSAFWAPVALLFARRFLLSRSWPALLGFVVTLVLQCWTSLTLGLELLILLGLLGIPVLFRAARTDRRRLLTGALVTLGALAISQGPIALQYARVHREAGFERTLVENIIDSGDLLGFVSAPRLNWWLGPLTSDMVRAERQFYPGIIAVLLAGVGLVALGHRVEPASPHARWRRVDLAIAAAAAIVAIVRVSTSAGPLDALSWVLLAMSACVAAAVWVGWRRSGVREWWGGLRSSASDRAFFLAFTVVAALLSLGPVILVAGHRVAYGPYGALYALVPGLTSIRAPARFHIYTMLGLAVLAGYGTVGILDATRSRIGRWLAVGVAVLILVDVAPGPLPLQPAPVRDALPPIVRWLRDLPDSSAIVELPIAPNGELWRECDRLFDSISHHKRMVNGYSGFFPRAHEWVRLEYERHGLSAALLEYFARIGANFLILPADSADEARGRNLREVWRGNDKVIFNLGAVSSASFPERAHGNTR